ncbi:TolC family protein [Saccharicrinis sp. FJH62]|uniref:TolC family protein n=1 Tax=Saccharicrinis sp. FJH62 TaxID=3344657 RepID=UPI0035D52169
MKYIYLIFILLLSATYTNSQTRNLSYYLEKAKENSPLIHETRNMNKLLDLNMDQIQAVLSKPKVTADINVLFAPIINHNGVSDKFQWVSSGANNYSGYDLAGTDGGQYQAVVTVKQPLFNKSKLDAYQNDNTVSHQINENKIALSVHEVQQIVGYQYLLCIRSQKEKRIQLALIRDLKDQKNTLQKLVDNGVYKQTDLMLLDIELKNYAIEYTNQISAYQQNLYDLNLLCGINDTTLVSLTDTVYHLQPDIEAQSAFLTSYRLDSMKLLTEQDLYDLKYKPQIDLFGSAGMNAVYLPGINRLGFSTGLSFSITLFDGNQRHTEHNKTQIHLESLQFKKEQFLSKYRMQNNGILNRIRLNREQQQLLDEQITQYKTILDAYSKELSQGETSIMDIKNIYRDMASKEKDMLRLKTEEQFLINAYNYWNY